MSDEITFNRPCFAGPELEYARRALGNLRLSGDGAFTKQCHAILERITGARKALLTTSCTHALEMCAVLLRCRPGDEVIVPSFTFVSTANAFALHGARPVFCDVRPDTLNLDETKLEALITPKTKAICVVHYAGVGCEMDAILAIASRHGVAVVEDNAHGLFAKYRGRPLGSFGALATQSFHETKNVQCGEGGALLLNDPSLHDRAEILREKGTNRSAFFRGQVDKYTWVDVGSSWLPSDLLAAILLAQLEHADEIQAKRGAIWNRYREGLSGWAGEHGIGLPTVPAHCEQPWHMFYLMLPDVDSRQRLMDGLRRRGIHAVFHYQALNASPMGRALGGRPGQCPVTERVSDCLLRLPLWNDMTPAQTDRVIEGIRAVWAGG